MGCLGLASSGNSAAAIAVIGIGFSILATGKSSPILSPSSNEFHAVSPSAAVGSSRYEARFPKGWAVLTRYDPAGKRRDAACDEALTDTIE